nr:ThuA domain-containing protein [Hymenobacter sp. DG25B]
MNSVFRCWLLMGTLLLGCSRSPTPSPPSQGRAVLVFYKTQGFHHTSIPAGLATLQQLGREHGLRVDTTRQAARFVADTLRRYDAVVFLNTTGDVLDAAQQAALEQYIRQGHGFMGVHAAADTEYNWPWYQGLVGPTLKATRLCSPPRCG